MNNKIDASKPVKLVENEVNEGLSLLGLHQYEMMDKPHFCVSAFNPSKMNVVYASTDEFGVSILSGKRLIENEPEEPEEFTHEADECETTFVWPNDARWIRLAPNEEEGINPDDKFYEIYAILYANPSCFGFAYSANEQVGEEKVVSDGFVKGSHVHVRSKQAKEYQWSPDGYIWIDFK